PLLKDEDHYVRLQAVWCVRKVGKQASDAVPALLERLKDSHSEVREQATKALAEIGPPKDSDVSNLRDLVTGRDVGLRYDAAGILGKMGAKGAVVEDFIAQLENGDATARVAAIEGIKLLDRAAAVGPLLAALADPEPTVREAAVTGLYRLPAPHAAQVV